MKSSSSTSLSLLPVIIALRQGCVTGTDGLKTKRPERNLFKLDNGNNSIKIIIIIILGDSNDHLRT